MAKASQAKSELPAGTGSTTGQPLADEGQPTPPAAIRWRVEVHGMPTREVEASDKAGAWEAFRKLFNVTATKHPIHATRIN